MIRDGSDVNNPLPIAFTGGYDGNAGTPITLSAYWFFKYANQPTNTYAAWQYVGPYGNMKAGEAWTMKGPGTGTITDPQNYTFVGKPNNSTTAEEISLNVNANNDYLVGNPFASALDANDFIADNPHLDGTLYFWEHWGGGSHYLQQYQGGYAMYNLSGGTPAMSHPAVSQTGSGTITPERYVPVGQGFFVKARSNGNIVLSNTQRNFIKEGSASIFVNPEDRAASDDSTYQEDDTIYDEADERTKFRFGFDAPSGLHREILLTIDDNTTFDYDYGYDGVINDMQEEDMTWVVQDRNAVIQGAPNVVDQKIFPIQLQVQSTGKNIISLTSAAFNLDPENQAILLWDQLTNQYTNLRVTDFTIELAPGEYKDRFAIVFETRNTDTSDDDNDDDDDNNNDDSNNDSDNDDDSGSINDDQGNDEDDQTLSLNDFTTDVDRIIAYFIPNQNAIYIDNGDNLTLEKVALYNVAGQLIKQLRPQSDVSQLIVPVDDMSTGVYLINVTTPQGVYATKLIIN